MEKRRLGYKPKLPGEKFSSRPMLLMRDEHPMLTVKNDFTGEGATLAGAKDPQLIQDLGTLGLPSSFTLCKFYSSHLILPSLTSG